MKEKSIKDMVEDLRQANTSIQNHDTEYILEILFDNGLLSERKECWI